MPIVPCAVARPARLAACARPRLRRMVIASSMSPLASVRAALHSIMPAPVLSRSCLTCSAVIAICLELQGGLKAALYDRLAAAVQRKRRQMPAPDSDTATRCYALGGRRRFAALRTVHAAQTRGGVGRRCGLFLRRRFLGHARLALRAAAADGVGDLRREQPDRPQGVVVAGDDVVHFVGIAVGVDDADDRNLQLARLVDGNLLLAGVDDEDRVGQARHVADALEILEQLALLFLVAGDLFLRQRIVAAVGDHRLEVAEPAEAALNRGEVGQQAAQPALVDVEHPAALCLFGNHVLRLPLGAHEEDGAAVGREAGDEVLGVAELAGRLGEVDDVDAIPLAEDERLHLRIPPLRLVAEMDARLEQILCCNTGQVASPLA